MEEGLGRQDVNFGGGRIEGRRKAEDGKQLIPRGSNVIPSQRILITFMFLLLLVYHDSGRQLPFPIL